MTAKKHPHQSMFDKVDGWLDDVQNFGRSDAGFDALVLAVTELRQIVWDSTATTGTAPAKAAAKK